MTKRKLDKTARDATKMWGLAEKEGKVSGRTAFDAMRLGDKAGKEVVDEYIKYLAVGISNMINIFQPEVFVIGGGVSKAGDLLFNPLQACLKEQLFPVHYENLRLLPARFGADAGLIGAGLMAADYAGGVLQ